MNWIKRIFGIHGNKFKMPSRFSGNKINRPIIEVNDNYKTKILIDEPGVYIFDYSRVLDAGKQVSHELKAGATHDDVWSIISSDLYNAFKGITPHRIEFMTIAVRSDVRTITINGIKIGSEDIGCEPMLKRI